MDRKIWLLPGILLCLTMASGCTNDETRGTSADVEEIEWQLERTWQNIEVLVTVPSGTYRFEVAGQCGLEGQAIYAEGTSRNAEFSVHVSKDPYSGLVVFFSNKSDEWEIMLDPADDTSEINRKKIFSFSGDVPSNHGESNPEPLEISVLCTDV